MIIPLFVSFKGCPHRCLFCNQPIINGTAYHGVEDVIFLVLQKIAL